MLKFIFKIKKKNILPIARAKYKYKFKFNNIYAFIDTESETLIYSKSTATQ